MRQMAAHSVKYKAAYTLANILFPNGPCNALTSWESGKLQTNIVTTELWTSFVFVKKPMEMVRNELFANPSFIELRMGEEGHLRYRVPVSNVRRERPHSLHSRSPVYIHCGSPVKRKVNKVKSSKFVHSLMRYVLLEY